MADFNPYNTPEWRAVRAEVLERDGWRCQVRGPKCKGRANEVDHIIPWEDGGAFLDPGNLRAACKTCNVGRANRQKHREGWRRAEARIILIVGPVGGGKSTYAQEHAGPDDVVIDYDAIADALGPSTHHAASGDRHSATMVARNALLQQVRRGEIKAERIWIVSANPRAESMFPYHELVVCDPGREEALRRCREERPAHFAELVEGWYAARGAIRREW